MRKFQRGRRLVLHIGTEKTGTTSIQEFIYKNRKLLRRRGIHLSDVLGTPNNQKLVAYFQEHIDDFLKDHRVSSAEEKAAFFAGFLDSFREEVDKHVRPGQTLCVTSELFHSRIREPSSVIGLQNYLASMFDDIKILCYIREQSSLATSFYSTTVKAGNAGGFEHFLHSVQPSDHYYNYEIFLEKWRAAFGLHAMRVRVFDKEQLYEGNILKDVLLELNEGIDFSEFAFDIPEGNRSLGNVGIEIARIINRQYPRYREDGSINHLRWELINVLSRSELGGIGKLVNERAGEIYDSFADSNLRVAETYLGLATNPFNRPGAHHASTEETNPDPEFLKALYDFVEVIFRQVIADRVMERRHAIQLRETAEMAFKSRDLPLWRIAHLLEVAQQIKPDGTWIRRSVENVRKAIREQASNEQ